MPVRFVLSPRRLIAAVLTMPIAIMMILVAPASTTHAATVYKDTLRGFMVLGSSESLENCVETATLVVGDKDSIYYQHISYNFCTDTYVSILQGEAAPTTFDVTSNLSSARVVATIPLTDGITGDPAGDITLDNTWTATGRAATTSFNNRTSLPGEYVERTKYTGTTRQASIAGSVALDSGFIGKTTQMSVTILH